MAVCGLCEKDMLETSACIERRLVFGDPESGDIERTGTEDDVVKPIPYGEESLYDDDEATGTCHDCGVAVGEYHHPGCDMEECPNPECDERQLFICDCHPNVLTKGQ